jgi:hypothetical protein
MIEMESGSNAFKFPGQGGFATHVPGDGTGNATIPMPPAGQATVRIIGSVASAGCAFTNADNCGAVTWSTPPADIVFTSSKRFWLHYTFTVPEGGCVPVSLAVTQTDSQTEEDSLTGEAESRFAGDACASSGGGGGPTPGTGTTPPSNSFTVGKLKGTTLFVNVASHGKVTVTQRGSSRAGASASAAKKLLKPSSATGGPGLVKVKLKLTATAKKALKHRHKLKIKAKVTFTPDGGTSASRNTTLKLKQR